MQSRSRIFDDLSQLMTNAAGVAQGVKDEAESVVRGRMERLIAEMDLVPREEFEAVKDMASKARLENEQLRAEIEELKALAKSQTKKPAAKKPAARKPAAKK